MRIVVLAVMFVFVVMSYSLTWAQVKWSAPVNTYPKQWSTGTPPPPFYERAPAGTPETEAPPAPGMQAAAPPVDPSYYNQPADENHGLFRRLKPRFSGNPFIRPPMYP